MNSDLTTGNLDDHRREAAAIGDAVTTPVQLWVAYQRLDAMEQSLVEAARRLHRGGASWAALASPFGISRQGARKRWADDAQPAGWVDEATGLTSGGLVAACSRCGSMEHDRHPDR